MAILAISGVPSTSGKSVRALHIIAVLIAESLDQVLLFSSCPQSEKYKYDHPRHGKQPSSKGETKAKSQDRVAAGQ